jgi:hypothetical protein
MICAGNPKRFLQEYYLKISRSTVTGEAMYWLSAYSHDDLAGRTVYERAPRPGRFLGNLHTHDSKIFKLEPYDLAPRLAGQGVIISAHHVPVVQSNALNVSRQARCALSDPTYTTRRRKKRPSSGCARVANGAFLRRSIRKVAIGEYCG